MLSLGTVLSARIVLTKGLASVLSLGTLLSPHIPASRRVRRPIVLHPTNRTGSAVRSWGGGGRRERADSMEQAVGRDRRSVLIATRW